MSDVPTMNTGDVCRRIGLTIPAAILEEIGFKPVGQDKRAQLWAQSDYPAMCVSIGNWVKERQRIPMQPKPPAKARKGATAGAAAPTPPTAAKSSSKPAAAKNYDVDDL